MAVDPHFAYVLLFKLDLNRGGAEVRAAPAVGGRGDGYHTSACAYTSNISIDWREILHDKSGQHASCHSFSKILSTDEPSYTDVLFASKGRSFLHALRILCYQGGLGFSRESSRVSPAFRGEHRSQSSIACYSWPIRSGLKGHRSCVY